MSDLATNRFRSRGIVLDEQVYGESSKILRIFTRDRGKLSVMAKGALRAKSSILSLTQPMLEGDYLFSMGKTFAYIHEGRIIKDHYKLKNDFRAMVAGTFILEVLDKSLEYGQVNTKIYDLVDKTLSQLEEGFSRTLVNAFLIKGLTFLGYRPIIGKRSKFIGNSTRYFDPKSGIIEYGLKAGKGRTIQEEDLDYIEKILYSPLDDLPGSNTCDEYLVFDLLMDLLYTHLDLTKINSYDLLATF